MISRNQSLIIIAAGIIIFVAGVFGFAAHHFPFIMMILGVLLIVSGIVFLSLNAGPLRFSYPHPVVIGIAIAAAGVHSYEQLYESSGKPSMGFWLWAMMPHVLCLAMSSVKSVRTPVITGAMLSFIFGLWGYYAVYINPQSSTAAIALVFIPLWSAIIIIPVGTFITWVILKYCNLQSDRRKGSKDSRGQGSK